jgi:hypothetical protein
MTNSKLDPVAVHRAAVELYREVSALASDNYPERLQPFSEQWDAYLLLPDLIDRCKENFERIPEQFRPPHYLRA